LIEKKGAFIFIVFLTILFILLSNSGCFAQANRLTVLLDGNILNAESDPVIINGKIFIPARDIVEALGGRITWFPALKLLNIIMADRDISVVMGVPEAEVNGKVFTLENSPSIIQNRVMLPVEIISLIADLGIDWDENSRQLEIIRKKNFITNIRSYTHTDKTRVVIDVSEKTSYKIITLNSPERIVIDIDASMSKLNAEQKEILINDYLVNRVRTGQFNQDTVRIVADLKNKYDYDVFELSSPQRIVLDIYMPQGQVAQNKPIESIKPEVNVEEIKVLETEQKKPENTGKHVIVVDPGHGGTQPGAIGPTGLKEKDVVLGIGLKLKNALQKDGFTVYMTRDKDIDVPLENRPLMALQREADVFLSIHINSAFQKGSPTARGVETYVLNSRYIGASAKDVADRENKASQYHNYEDNILNQIIADLEESASIGFSLDLADTVQKRLVQNTGLEDRGVKQAPFIVLKGVNMAAVLVEVGFICNPNEEKLLKTADFQEKVAQALSQSVKDYVKNIPEQM